MWHGIANIASKYFGNALNGYHFWGAERHVFGNGQQKLRLLGLSGLHFQHV